MTNDAEMQGTANDALGNVETVYRVDWRRSYPESVVRVWAAISTAEEISAWMKYPTRLEARLGGVIHIDFSSQGSLEGVVCEFEPLRSLIYTWGDSLVKWEIEDVAGETQLHLAHVGVQPELAAGLGAGWHAFLDQLQDYLIGKSRHEPYRELKSRYENEVQRIGVL